MAIPWPSMVLGTRTIAALRRPATGGSRYLRPPASACGSAWNPQASGGPVVVDALEVPGDLVRHPELQEAEGHLAGLEGAGAGHQVELDRVPPAVTRNRHTREPVGEDGHALVHDGVGILGDPARITAHPHGDGQRSVRVQEDEVARLHFRDVLGLRSRGRRRRSDDATEHQDGRAQYQRQYALSPHWLHPVHQSPADRRPEQARQWAATVARRTGEGPLPSTPRIRFERPVSGSTARSRVGDCGGGSARAADGGQASRTRSPDRVTASAQQAGRAGIAASRCYGGGPLAGGCQQSSPSLGPCRMVGDATASPPKPLTGYSSARSAKAA